MTMSASKPLSRRRFIAITALVGVGAALPSTLHVLQHSTTPLYQWRGFAMGADASIKLYSEDTKKAEALTQACLQEILRLEQFFSLYEPTSTISALNHNGRLNNPPHEFVELLRQAITIGHATEGAFDISVQPLWQAYKNNTSATAVKSAHARVNFNNIRITKNTITFTQPNMAITLNGIAQGYITDKVTELLHRHGINHVLVNMGEMRALGHHPGGAPWQVGIADPDNPHDIVDTAMLSHNAIATSGNYGVRSEHLFDPKTGNIVQRYKSVSVIAPTAATADALSTALSILPHRRVSDILKRFAARAIYVMPQGDVVKMG